MCKTWVVLVTCANSQGIYLDLIPDCTSKCCVDALKDLLILAEHQKLQFWIMGNILLVLMFKIFQLHQVFIGNSTQKVLHGMEASLYAS